MMIIFLLISCAMIFTVNKHIVFVMQSMQICVYVQRSHQLQFITFNNEVFVSIGPLKHRMFIFTQINCTIFRLLLQMLDNHLCRCHLMRAYEKNDDIRCWCKTTNTQIKPIWIRMKIENQPQHWLPNQQDISHLIYLH